MSIFMLQTQQKADANKHKTKYNSDELCKYVSQKEEKKSVFCIYLTFPDFTRHFFSSLTESVDGCFAVILNQ